MLPVGSADLALAHMVLERLEEFSRFAVYPTDVIRIGGRTSDLSNTFIFFMDLVL